LKRSEDKVATQKTDWFAAWPNCLQQGIKLLDGDLGGFDMRECASFYGVVCGNRNFQHAFGGSFLKANVTSPLSNHYKPGTLERFDNPVES
jgi:hypothetical protein